MKRIVIDKRNHFYTIFDDETGFTIRSGIMAKDKNGKLIDTGVDPFMASFPQLLDVGIMGHCIHGKTGLCLKAGIQCYQDGFHRTDANMTVEDFCAIAEQCKGKCFQFALGGAGDPDQHENFEEILKICRENNIVPNFTTSGFGMTPEIAALCKKYCGAVAISWYRSEYTVNAINMLLAAGVKTNVHYVVSKNTINEAITRIKEDSFPEGVNAVIFLLHKPVGLGTKEEMITVDNPDFKRFMDVLNNEHPSFKFGFDSCTIPALVRNSNFNVATLDTCEGARFSAYITSDMKLLPCSFDNQKERWAVDLRTTSIQKAWDSAQFESFRDHFRNNVNGTCKNCTHVMECMGGCPITPEIVLCEEKGAV